MSKHSKAVEHLVALNRYCLNIENCKDCVIEDYCHCNMLTEADVKKLKARAEELEVQERFNAYKDLEETRNICRKFADEIRGLGDKE